MKQATAFMTGAGTVAVLAVGLQVGLGGLSHSANASSEQSTSTSSSASSSATSTTPSAAASETHTATPSATPSAAANSSASGSSSSSAINGTFHGVDVPDDAGYGDVQVDVVIANGKITDVVFISANATKGRDQAFPMLRSETLSAQSASISNIGGATFTTDAYIKSVQSALDAAGFKG